MGEVGRREGGRTHRHGDQLVMPVGLGLLVVGGLWQLLLLTLKNGLKGWLVCCLGVEGGLCVAFCSGS